MRKKPKHRQKALLTSRETEVLRLIAEGSTDNEIARAMDVQRASVRTWLRRIQKKTGIQRRIWLAEWFMDKQPPPENWIPFGHTKPADDTASK